MQTQPSQGATAVASFLRPQRLGVFAASVVAGVTLGAAGWLTRDPTAFQPVATEAITAVAATLPAAPPAPVGPVVESVAVTIARNDTLDGIFRRLQLSLQDLAELRGLPEVRRALDRLRPGDVIELKHLNGELASLTRRLSATETLSVTREPAGFKTDIIENPLEIERATLAGTVNSSLFASVNGAGGSSQLAVELAEVFQYDIDFVNSVQPGDTFAVTYEQQWQDGEFIRDGAILAAQFVNEGKTYRAVRYARPDGKAEYYTPDGRVLRKAFLRFPVDFSRISSGFSLARFHPVLNRYRAHKGVDFAAPTGTPVKAAGDGRITFRGVKGGYGNVVILTHSNGVTTLYGHLSRFAKNRKVGQRVSQGEIIGYVGMTGLASGPHLHYEYRVNGVHRDPAKVKLVVAEPLPQELKADFEAQTRPLLAELDRSVAAAAGTT